MTVVPAPIATPRVPPLGWWVVLGVAIALYLAVGWIAALGWLALMLAHRLRPFDFLTSYLLVLAGGSFVNYTTGTLTFQMTIITIFIVFMLYCYVLSRRRDSLVVPRTPGTMPLLLYLGLTFVNFGRGLLIGNSGRYAGLELIAALALGTTLLASNRRATRTEMRTIIVWLVVLSVAHMIRGMAEMIAEHRRVGGAYFGAITGLVTMLLFNFALRESGIVRRAGWVLALSPALLHQFLSFTRGYWLALMVAMLFSVGVYVGRGEGAKQRMRDSFKTFALISALLVVGALVIGASMGIGGIGNMVSERLASSTGTEYHGVTGDESSNIVRLVEYMKVLGDIQKQWLFGYGLGYYFVVREPMTFTLLEQWFTHENYLLVWLKQGIIGLAIWIWMLLAMTASGLRGKRLPDFYEQSWCAGAAACVVYCIVYSFVHFPLAEVPTVFPFALIVGIAMRLGSTETFAIRWKAAAPRTASAEAVLE
jgi:O-antigen ligase